MQKEVISKLFSILFLCVLSQGSGYRFDYEYSSGAGGWLKYHFIPGSWREARLRCHAEGAVLASPLNHDLKAAMISMVAQRQRSPNCSSPSMIFTGVHATFSKGDYSSIEGVPLLRLPITWAEGEPDNYEDAESCLAMLANDQGSMSDESCTRVLPYICYKPGKILALNECGTIDPEYKLEPKTGNCYKFHWRGRPWRVAYMTCVAEGGHLVTIDSQEELDVIHKILAEHPDSSFVSTSGRIGTGFHDWGERSFFMTIHGENLENNFNVWHTGEPNNLTSTRTNDAGEFCGSIWRSGKLNDLLCGATVPFICEKKPDSLL